MLSRIGTLLLVATLGWSCGTASDTPPVRRSEVGPRDSARADALPGRAVIVPLMGRAWADDAWFRPGAVLEARFDDGSIGAARVVRAGVDPGPGLSAPDRAAAWWLAWPGRWEVTRADGADAPVGVWLLVIDAPPPDAARVTLGGQTLALDPLALPKRAPAAWAPPFAHDASAQPLAAALALEARSPLTRWRSRWLTRGLRAVADAEQGPDRFEDPLLEALADLTESRVAAAMARLESLDAGLAGRVARALTLTLLFPARESVPAWPIADRDIDLLLHDLLDRGTTDDRVLAAARAWLRAQPDGFSWVADDAGITDGLAGTTLASVGIANLSEEARPAWIASPAREAPEMTLCPPFSGMMVTAAAWSPDQPAPASGTVTISLGQWRAQALLRAAPLSVAPPGLIAGPFLHDWTLPALRTADDRSLIPDPAWGTAALLHRVPTVSADAGGPAVERTEHAWTLRLECWRPASDTAASDRVTVWIGLTGAPLAAITVSADGTVDASGRHAPAEAMVATLTDRWTATIQLPPDAIDADGVLRLGMARVDGRGVRSAWPRSLLPWSPAPGRLAIDTRAWDR